MAIFWYWPLTDAFFFILVNFHGYSPFFTTKERPFAFEALAEERSKDWNLTRSMNNFHFPHSSQIMFQLYRISEWKIWNWPRMHKPRAFKRWIVWPIPRQSLHTQKFWVRIGSFLELQKLLKTLSCYWRNKSLNKKESFWNPEFLDDIIREALSWSIVITTTVINIKNGFGQIISKSITNH